MLFSYTEEELAKCYNSEEERASDEVEWSGYNKSGEFFSEMRCGISTVAQMNYNKYGYDYYFNLENIRARDVKDYPDMVDWQINANFYGIDITTEEGWNEYLEYGDYNYMDNIGMFTREFIDSLERPLIFRNLLNIYGKHYDLEEWKSLRDSYLEETEYSYNIFLKYSDQLGFIDDEFEKVTL